MPGGLWTTRENIALALSFLLCLIAAQPALAEASTTGGHGSRSIRPGMTREEVIAATGATPTADYDSAICCEATAFSLPAECWHEFDDDGGLCIGAYDFSRQDADPNEQYGNRLQLTLAYTEAYDNPVSAEAVWPDERHREDPGNWGLAASLGQVMFTAAWETGAG